MTWMHRTSGFRHAKRRASTIAIALALLAGVATGCVGDRDPTSYSDSVRDHFVEGCVATGTSAEPTKVQLKDRRTYCGCIYAQMSDEKTGISFDEFSSAQKKIQADPKDKANAIDVLIPEFARFEKACQSGPSAS